MKKVRIIVPAIFVIIVIGLLAAYAIYGSTLIDITSEESINKNIAIDPQYPITILKTAKAGNCFGILYKDPLDEDYDFAFSCVIKSPFYKNRYKLGGTTYCTGEGFLSVSLHMPDEEAGETQTDMFLFYYGNNPYKYNKCSIYTYSDCGGINYEEISTEEEVAEKVKEIADTIKKIDEIELPDDNIFITTKTYNLDYSYDVMDFYNGEISEKEMKQKELDTTDSAIAEYREYLKGINNE